MTSKAKELGSACYTGITLREYLAGQALTGLLACGIHSQASDTSVAGRALLLADALLVELAGGQDEKT